MCERRWWSEAMHIVVVVVKASANRLLWRRLARAPEAVADRPVGQDLSLRVLSRPERPGAP